MIRLKRGLDLPVAGVPDQSIEEAKTPTSVALLGGDYIGMKPTMAVRVGDRVKLGDLLFTDKKTPGVRYTSPGAGRIVEIHRGDKRALLSVVVELSGRGVASFKSYRPGRLSSLNRDQVVDLLVESGLWTAFRTRPFSRVPSPETIPSSVFVTAIDTNPLAPAIGKCLEGREEDFSRGLKLVSRLTDGKVFLCSDGKAKFPDPDVENLHREEFSGPHPAGNVGTHIHFLDPVHRARTVWHIGLQDVVAVGRLFATGKLPVERIVSVAGPSVARPRLLKTRIGASLDDLTRGELKEGEHRVISGSMLSGHSAEKGVGYLGRYHQQVSVLPEYRKREFLGWLSPGWNRHSVKLLFLSSFVPRRRLNLNTSTNGETRAIIPSGNYERVTPIDVMPLFLLRALAVDDVEEAEKLGALELDEEDLALCAYVCPSKLEFGPMLRRNLTLIEREG